ncbi:MAG TPA: Spy/CpxP family protein refolding chaperone [Gemmatimonadaceae bacterium]|nr:Spy/CpxP family protein refolding chaperone [Gemmatimonadaceae bacterium]
MLSLMAAAALLAAAPAVAQGGPRDPQQMREMMVSRLKDSLALTPEQVQQVDKIVEKEVATMGKIRDEARASQDPDARQAAFAKMRDARESADKEIEKVLTPEQVTKFHAMRAAEQERRSQRGGPPGR